jgi:hypothetical protein
MCAHQVAHQVHELVVPRYVLASKPSYGVPKYDEPLTSEKRKIKHKIPS